MHSIQFEKILNYDILSTYTYTVQYNIQIDTFIYLTGPFSNKPAIEFQCHYEYDDLIQSNANDDDEQLMNYHLSYHP